MAAILGVLTMLTSSELPTYVGIVLVGLGFANIFPLVFSITIDQMPERSNELSGLMVTAISGGAIVPLIMGKVVDSTSVLAGFAVPLLCLLYISFASFVSMRKASITVK